MFSGNGKRQYFRKCSFFGNQDVEVFFALNDPGKRPLYRAKLLSEKLGFDNNRV